jgi:hypothetical protein
MQTLIINLMHTTIKELLEILTSVRETLFKFHEYNF